MKDLILFIIYHKFEHCSSNELIEDILEAGCHGFKSWLHHILRTIMALGRFFHISKLWFLIC